MSLLRVTEVAEPATPAANKIVLYCGTDGRWRQKDDQGIVTVFAAGYEKNLLINGGFDFCQRAAVALTNITGPSATNRVYSADRWGFTVGNVTTPQFQQVDTTGAPESGLSARYYARYKQLTNAAKIALTQTVLSRGSIPTLLRTVRFQCLMKYSVGSGRDMRIGLVSNAGTVDAPTAAWISAFNGNGTDPTFGANLALVVPVVAEGTGAVIAGNAVTCPITTTWTLFSATFVVPSTCKNLMPVIFSNNTFAANDDLLVTQCSLTDGADLQDWVPREWGTELLLCQQYYAKTFALATVPAASITAGKIQWSAGVAGAVAGTWGGWRFPMRMNKAPTIALFNPLAAGVQVRQISATAGDCTSSSGANITDQSCEFTCTPGASAVIGSILGVHATAEAEL